MSNTESFDEVATQWDTIRAHRWFVEAAQDESKWRGETTDISVFAASGRKVR